MRLSRGGNRRINTAIQIAAVTQQRLGGEGAAYYAKQTAAGKTRTEAMRLLRRKISDRVYAAIKADESSGNGLSQGSEPISTIAAGSPLSANDELMSLAIGASQRSTGHSADSGLHRRA